MNGDSKTRNSLICYLVLVFAISSVFYTLIFTGSSLNTMALPLMWSPALAALITQRVLYGTFTGLGWRWPMWRYVLVAVLIPLVYCFGIYVPVWALGLGGVTMPGFLEQVRFMPIGLFLSLLTALGEEIGWRGFMVPALYRLGGFGWASLVAGVIWGVWHVPLIISGDYGAGTPLWYALPCFMLSVVGISVMTAWLRLRSGSVWPSAFFHAAHNMIIQSVFDANTTDTGRTHWITTEFGFGLTLVALGLGVYFWRRRGALPAPDAVPAVSSVANAQAV